MRFLALIFIIITLLHSTTLNGQIISAESFENINNTLIKITGPTTTQFVASQNYSIELIEGEYEISAHHLEQEECSSSEKVVVSGESMIFDLVLFCGLDDPFFLDESGVDFSFENQDSPQNLSLYFLGFLILFTIAIFLYYISKNKSKIKEDKTELDDDSIKILEIIKSHEGRILQSELRDILKFSESKMSLVLTELEVLEKIKRIKKGRGNIIKFLK